MDEPPGGLAGLLSSVARRLHPPRLLAEEIGDCVCSPPTSGLEDRDGLCREVEEGSDLVVAQGGVSHHAHHGVGATEGSFQVCFNLGEDRHEDVVSLSLEQPGRRGDDEAVELCCREAIVTGEALHEVDGGDAEQASSLVDGHEGRLARFHGCHGSEQVFALAGLLSGAQCRRPMALKSLPYADGVDAVLLACSVLAIELSCLWRGRA